MVAASIVSSANAAGPIPGVLQSSFISPNQIEESCSIPRTLDLEVSREAPKLSYLRVRPEDESTVKKICRTDFYDSRESTRESVASVTCPKLSSTNPSLMIHELPYGMTREDFIRNECPKPKHRVGKLISKFKQSISCSYTPAILSYPRFAEMLKSEIQLPFTAYRSMDRLEHFKIATEAQELARRSAGNDSLIAQTWRSLYRADLNPAGAGAKLFRDGGTQIYGGLIPEISDEGVYYAANGATRGDRVANFQMTPAFHDVTSPLPIVSWGISRRFSPEVAQRLILLREMGDLIILDTLLNQQDRFGNLNFRNSYLKISDGGSTVWSRIKTPGSVPVRRMLLADNDCAIAKINRMSAAHIAERVTHLHPDSYLALQNMNRMAERGMLSFYLKNELLFTDVDVKSVESNISMLAHHFKQKCLNGSLYLDADLAQWLGKKTAVDSKTLCRSL